MNNNKSTIRNRVKLSQNQFHQYADILPAFIKDDAIMEMELSGGRVIYMISHELLIKFLQSQDGYSNNSIQS